MPKFIYLLLLSIIVNIESIAQTGERLMIDWPDEYNWKVGSDDDNQNVHQIEVIPANETLDNWTIIGTMLSIKGIKNVPMDAAMNMMFQEAKKNSDNARLTFISKDEKVKYPWILFKIEASSFHSNPNPESQLFYVVQGETALYSNFVALKKSSLSKDFVDKWIAIFKKSEVVTQ